MLKLKLEREKHQRILLILGIVLISLILNLSINICYAQDNKGSVASTAVTDPVICFKEADANKIIVRLETADDYEVEIDLLKQGNLELEKQINLLKEVNKLQTEQLLVSKQTINSYKELLKTQKEAYEKQIENTKPSVWGKIFAAVGGIGIGVLIGLLL